MRVFNLSRLCRPKQFQQLIGQELIVKVLCNSLALNKIFPTYIFSGPRGLGKTSSARIFASALICKRLEVLLSARTSAIPCLDCESCVLFATGKHPDFIEIDAASNTGIDNIREIQENALLMPVCSKYKIYLIDEVHMLSRAAFNAFLKMLEEPPSTAVFLMATTELHKVPETIRSRSLQLLFWPASNASMVDFLVKFSDQNNIKVYPKAIDLIAQLSGGSFRDAINKLEQLSLLSIEQDQEEQVKACAKLFGVVALKRVVNLLNALLTRDKSSLSAFIDDFCKQDFAASNVFEQILATLSACMKYKIAFQISDTLDPLIVQLANECPEEQLNLWTRFFWDNEEFFYASKNKGLLLQTLIMQLFHASEGPESGIAEGQGNPWPKNNVSGIGKEVDNQQSLKACSNKKDPKPLDQKGLPQNPNNLDLNNELQGEQITDSLNLKKEVAKKALDQSIDQVWNTLLESKSIATDKLLVSILKQAKNVSQINQTLILKFNSGGEFFKNKIYGSQQLILDQITPLLQDAKYLEVKMEIDGSKEALNKPLERKVLPKASKQEMDQDTTINSISNKSDTQNIAVSKKLTKLTNMNEKQWPKSSLMVDLFKGSVESE